MSETLRDVLAAYLRAHPGKWIDGMTLAGKAGSYAWRTRLSECRTQLGMNIENRQRTIRDHSFGCPAIQAWDMEGACRCGLPVRRTISEYRLVEAKTYANLLQIAEAS